MREKGYINAPNVDILSEMRLDYSSFILRSFCLDKSEKSFKNQKLNISGGAHARNFFNVFSYYNIIFSFIWVENYNPRLILHIIYYPKSI